MNRSGRIVDPDLWSPHVARLIALSGKVASWPTMGSMCLCCLIEVTGARVYKSISQTSGDVGGRPVDLVRDVSLQMVD
jgi:hypothetical protein